STCHFTGTRSTRQAMSPHIALNSGGSCAAALAGAARASTAERSARFTGARSLSARTHRFRLRQPLLHQRHQLGGRVLGVLLLGVDQQLGRVWLLVGVRDAGESLDLTGARALVQALDV